MGQREPKRDKNRKKMTRKTRRPPLATMSHTALLRKNEAHEKRPKKRPLNLGAPLSVLAKPLSPLNEMLALPGDD